MAEERDDADRTEEPTERRLTQAREDGRVAQSKEVATCLMLGTMTVAALLAGGGALAWSARELGGVLGAAHRVPLGAGLDPWLGTALASAALPWLAIAAAVTLAAIAGPVLQGAVVLTGKPLAPKLERISPLKGLKRLVSLDSLLEFLKGLVKLAAGGGAAALAGWAGRGTLVDAVALPPGAAAAAILPVAVAMLAAAAVAVAGLAALDVLHQRHKLHKELRMTRQELKEEMKQADGDPLIKQRVRQLRLERARRRSLAELPRATVVLTNPTHVAVALRYAADTPAPVLVAKGYDLVALAIRERARELGVPLVENPPLARALATACEPGEPIPIAQYEAVAQVIAFLMRARRARPGGPPGAALR